MRHIANQIAESYLEHRSSNCTYEPVFAVDDPTAHIPTLGVGAVDSGSVGDGDATMMTSPFSSTASSSTSSSRSNTKQQQFLVMKCGHCELYNIIV